MRRTICLVIIVTIAAPALAEPLSAGESKAHQIAQDTLPKLLAAETLLRDVLESRDLYLFSQKFEKPLMQLELTFVRDRYMKLGVTDKDMMVASGCGSAVTDLLQYGQALLKNPDPAWADYRLKRYREDLAQCRYEVKHPQPLN